MMLNATLALIGLAISAFFSGAELAFVSANPLQLEVWQKKNRWGSAAAMSLFSRPDRWLVTILVGTTLANVFTASFATAYLAAAGWHPLLSLTAIAVTVLLFGEVLPKTIAGERPNQLLRLTAPLGRLWELVLRPLASPVQRISNVGKVPEGNAPTLDRDDLKVLFSRQQDRQILPSDEKELIKQVFEFGETPISKAMTPRTEIAAIEENDDLAQLAHTFIESGYSKLPVYHDNLDAIIGVAYLYDLFKNPAAVGAIIKPVTLVPDSNTTFEVLRQLQKDERSIAIVLDEFGGTAGLVTMEDIFEELFGDFEDEFDDPDANVQKLPDGSLLVMGRTEIEDLLATVKLRIAEGEYETIGGYVTTTLGRIPRVGERLNLPMGAVTIKKATPRHIVQLQIWPPGIKVDAGNSG
ncbi:MAG: HlyC/CorC family transporter [Candidatus Marinimicrobia bacterium]|nr:HlyC/CorC family transporter [Candidatus Neomarinimicrobiota bacterium]